MRNSKLLISISFVLAVFATQSQAQPMSLFADPKARRIGDVLTVLIQENASASNRTATSTDKENTVDIGSTIPGAGNILGLLPLHQLESDFSNEYDAQGSTSRNSTLSARITVTVVGTKPNGDLIVEGVRTVKINGETEAIYLSGSVNPASIRRDNTILSSNIADLQVEYTGSGTITQAARPGVIVRFINWIF